MAAFKSDGNGSYVVDKRLWAVVLLVLVGGWTVAGWSAQNLVSRVDAISTLMSEKSITDATQDVEIRVLKETLARMESTLNALNARIK